MNYQDHFRVHQKIKSASLFREQQFSDSTDTTTPLYIIRKMMRIERNFWCNPSKTLLDPTCGSGGFLLEAVRRMYYGMRHAIPDDKKRLSKCFARIRGFDVDEAQLHRARQALYTLAKLVDIDVENIIIKQDFLSYNDSVKYDIVAGNPPFSISGKENLYEEFIIKAIDSLSNSGMLVQLMPRNWAMNASSALRKKVIAEAGDSIKINIIQRPPEWKGIDVEILTLSLKKNGQIATKYLLNNKERPIIDGLLCLDNTLDVVIQEKAALLVNKYGAIELFDPKKIETSECTSLCVSYKTQKQAREFRNKKDILNVEDKHILWDGGSGTTMFVLEQKKCKHNKKFENFLSKKRNEGYQSVVLYHGFMGKREKVPFQELIYSEKIDNCACLDVGGGRVFVVAVRNVEKHEWFIKHSIIKKLIVAFHQGVRPITTLHGVIPDISHLLSDDVDEREMQMKEWFT